jgi:hypothetical protein
VIYIIGYISSKIPHLLLEVLKLYCRTTQKILSNLPLITATPWQATCPNKALPTKERFHDPTLVYCVFCRATNPAPSIDVCGNGIPPGTSRNAAPTASQPPPSQGPLAVGTSYPHPPSSLPGMTTTPLPSIAPLTSILPPSTQPALSSHVEPSPFAGISVMRPYGPGGNGYAGQNAQTASSLRIKSRTAQSQPAHAGSPLAPRIPEAPIGGLPALIHQGRPDQQGGSLIGTKSIRLRLAIYRFQISNS